MKNVLVSSAFLLSYFLLYLFGLSLNRIYFDLAEEEISIRHVLKVYHRKPVFNLWLPLADKSACALSDSVTYTTVLRFHALTPELERHIS